MDTVDNRLDISPYLLPLSGLSILPQAVYGDLKVLRRSRFGPSMDTVDNRLSISPYLLATQRVENTTSSSFW